MEHRILTHNVLLENDGIKLTNISTNGHQRLHFVFKGKFSKVDSELATKAWSSHCEKHPNDTFIHIWDSSEMIGFENNAKNLWMSNLEKHGNQTDRIVLISGNIVIRGAARLMSNFSKHPLTVYRTPQEMNAAEPF